MVVDKVRHKNPEENRPSGIDWHREGVGGLWEEIGNLQFDFLVKQGLRPDQYFLDIGCGSLRGGVQFIQYLEVGHYYGIDKEPSLVEAGMKVELKRYGLESKAPHLLIIDDFGLSVIPLIHFNFMLAQSVFTHLGPKQIEECISRVIPRLDSNGYFYATFFESNDKRIHLGKPHPWRSLERGAAKYPFSFFQNIARKSGISVANIGEWNHPRGQKMLAFFR